MHEMSLCESILEVLQEQSLINGYSRIKTVRLEVGELAQVEVEALRFAFDVVMNGSLADGAKLAIVDIAGRGWCAQCEQSVAAHERFAPCPECGGFPLQITAGEEFRIKELEVE